MKAFARNLAFGQRFSGVDMNRQTEFLRLTRHLAELFGRGRVQRMGRKTEVERLG